jgi:hypothetical protein
MPNNDANIDLEIGAAEVYRTAIMFSHNPDGNGAPPWLAILNENVQRITDDVQQIANDVHQVSIIFFADFSCQ